MLCDLTYLFSKYIFFFNCDCFFLENFRLFILFYFFLRLNVAKYVLRKLAKLKWSIQYKINQIRPKPKTDFKSQKLKNPKTSLSEDSSYLWYDFFVLSKIVFLQGFLVLVAKLMSLFSLFLFSKNFNYPPNISILTNFKTFKSN